MQQTDLNLKAVLEEAITLLAYHRKSCPLYRDRQNCIVCNGYTKVCVDIMALSLPEPIIIPFESLPEDLQKRVVKAVT